MNACTCDLVAGNLHIPALTIQRRAIESGRPTAVVASSPTRYDNKIIKLMFCAETGKLEGWRVVDHVTTLLISLKQSLGFASFCVSFLNKNTREYFLEFSGRFLEKQSFW
jgi:hypothetical protein